MRVATIILALLAIASAGERRQAPASELDAIERTFFHNANYAMDEKR